MLIKLVFFIPTLLLFNLSLSFGQETQLSTVAQWMQTYLNVIKDDGQGPTIHARNLYHLSHSMHDAWSHYEKKHYPALYCKDQESDCIPKVTNNNEHIKDSLQNICISYAAFRLITNRLNEYGSKGRTMDYVINKLEKEGLDPHYSSMDFDSGKPADIGNYIGQKIYENTLNDGSGEEENYESQQYEFVNQDLQPQNKGTNLIYPNQYQAVNIRPFLNIKGVDKTLEDWNYLLVNTDYLTAHWGDVKPFALSRSKDDFLYLDPGPPPQLIVPVVNSFEHNTDYAWEFSTVAKWSEAHNSSNGTLWNLSKKGIVSMDNHLHEQPAKYRSYYQDAYENFHHKSKNEQLSKKGDYTRVIAEYWVDGPNTFSPPGHWIDILTYVNNHQSNQRLWHGEGNPLSQVEWDLKTYLLLSASLHDSAIACWQIKTHYNYVRPISAIRYLSNLGQSSNQKLPNYNSNGIALIEGHIELIKMDDPLFRKDSSNLHKIKIMSWRGPTNIDDPAIDEAGVDWILGEDWWPYQRYTFATPPFAGYPSGHSTFSVSAAIVLDHITGSPYFPDQSLTFTAIKNDFLQFENGPSENVTLAWATYYDAAIETCLSRIWGGIHPPCDDMAGRYIGKQVAENTIKLIELKYF